MTDTPAPSPAPSLRPAPVLDPSAPHPELQRLIAIVGRLRATDGCPWDREQTPQSMAPHLLEECFETLEALETGQASTQCEELGDVLMNVLMIAQIAGEGGAFDLEGVARTVAAKLVRRHPHVFSDAHAGAAADATPAPTTAGEVLQHWEAIKRREKAAPEDRPDGVHRSVLAGVPRNMPALMQALRMGEKAARVGFEWPDDSGPRAKVDEELAELDEALAAGDHDAIHDELGDVLFAVVNVARRAGVHPELALRSTMERFRTRFAHVEKVFGAALDSTPLDDMEREWTNAKALERASDGGPTDS